MSTSLSRSVSIIVPAYNEESAIGEVIAGLKGTGYDILVIDDGSEDTTGRTAAEARATVIRHLINLGQGAALQTGIECALRNGADYIVTFDADGQHGVADIQRLLNALGEQKADFALGTRFRGGTDNIPAIRKMLLRAATLFTRLTTGLRVSDSHNGFRAMTRRGASRIRLRQNRMAHASEILHQIAKSKLAYVEVPVTITYSAYSLGKGQRSSEAVAILLDLLAGGLRR
jgi:glycosyltransferase involved in cell wall biosynthesis